MIGGAEPGDHQVEGIGMRSIYPTMDLDVMDEVIMVDDDPAFAMVQELGRSEGLLAGSSGGAAVVAARRVAERLGEGRRIVILVPDSGERYLSQGVYPDPLTRAQR